MVGFFFFFFTFKSLLHLKYVTFQSGERKSKQVNYIIWKMESAMGGKQTRCRGRKIFSLSLFVLFDWFNNTMAIRPLNEQEKKNLIVYTREPHKNMTCKEVTKQLATLFKETFTFINEISICKGISFSVPGRGR